MLRTTSATLRRRMTATLCSSLFLRQVATSSTTAMIPTLSSTPAPVSFCSMSRRFGSDAGHGDEPAAKQGHYLLNKDDVLNRVLEVVKNFEKVDATKVTAESHFINDLGLDSLDVVEIVMALEQEFVLDIPDHDAEKIQSIQDAVEYLSQNPMAK